MEIKCPYCEKEFNLNERAESQRSGMTNKASQGKPMSRPAFGYIFEEGKLVPAQNFREVEEIFEEFLTTSISLRKLSQKHNLSINGLKKILRNFTYIGKVKFNNETFQGTHKPIIPRTAIIPKVIP